MTASIICKIVPGSPLDGYVTCPVCKSPVENNQDTLLLAAIKCTAENFEKYICSIDAVQNTQRQILDANGITNEKVEQEFQSRRIFQPGSDYRFCLIGCPICIDALTNLLGPKFTKISIGKINTSGRTHRFEFSKVLNYEDPNPERTESTDMDT